MILDRLILQNFKRFKDADIDFHNGITGIVGNNGTGKSSIVEAVFFALFGVSDKTLPSDYVVSSFTTDQCIVYLHFRIENDRYFIRRTFKKGKSVQHDATLTCNNETRATGVSQVDAEIRRIIGMGPADFRNTVYAAQKDLLTLLDLTPGKRKEWFLRALGIDYLNTGSQKILKDQLDKDEQAAALLQGELTALSRQDPAELEQTRKDRYDLNMKIAALTTEEKDRQIERTITSDRLQEYNLKVVRQSKQLDQVEHLRNEIGILNGRITSMTEQLGSLVVNEQDLQQLELTVAEIPKAREEIEAYRTKKATLDKLTIENAAVIREQENIQGRLAKVNAHLDACLQAIMELDDLNVKVSLALGYDADKGADDAVSDYRDHITEKVARIQSDIKFNGTLVGNLQGKLDTLRDAGRDGHCPVCLQQLGEHFEEVEKSYCEQIAETMVEGDRLASDLDAALKDTQRIPDLKPTLDRIKEIQILLGYRETREDEKAQLTRDLLDTTKKAKDLITAIEALAYNEEDHLACKQRLVELEAAQGRYTELTRKSAEQAGIRAKIAELSSQVTTKTAALAEVMAAIDKDPIDPAAGPRLTHEVEKLDLILKTISQDLATSTERERAAAQKIAELELAAERVGTLQQQVAAIKEEIEILKLTRAAIADYVIYIMQVVRARIESEVSSIISEITGGKYDQVLIDEDFNLLVRENDREYTVDRFSGGEQDDIAVALRIALSRYLAELHQVHESTLLIFDEIFGSQDEERRNNLLTALRSQESRFPQIILISHISEIQGEFANTLLVQGDGPVSTVKAVA